MVAFGIVLALASAVSESLVDVLRKKRATAFDAVVASWSIATFSALTTLLALVGVSFMSTASLGRLTILRHSFPMSAEFWGSLGVSLVCNVVTSYLYMRVLATADISMVLPLVTLTPVFLLLTAPLITHEFPSRIGVLGIVITTVGLYGLKFEDRKDGFWKPFLNLWSDPRNRTMLLIAFLWSISGPFDKRGSVAGGPMWYTLLLSAGMGVAFLPFMFRAGRWNQVTRSRAILRLLPLDAMSAFRSLCQFSAAVFLLIPYVIGIKRLSILFGMLWARFLFKEKHTGQRALASAVMLAGTFLILYAAAN